MKLEKRDLLYRPRRLRKSDNLRHLFRETRLHTDDLIAPVFVIKGNNIKNAIPSMPGIYQWSVDRISEEIDQLQSAGITRILLFGIPEQKDEMGSEAHSKSGIIQSALEKLNKEYLDLFIITDVCLCQYTEHGHCGVIHEGDVHNDSTLSLIGKQAVSHALAGSHMVAPSGMIDGMVGELRKALDDAGFNKIPIMSYAVKYASAFYGPFRDAADSTPQFGDRKSYQMDPGNIREAILEAELDMMEGADIIMVKPALAYLDVLSKIKQTSNIPLACYNVSGEYAMVKAAAEKGWLDHDKTMMEMLLCMKRSGADILVTYFAREAADLINKGDGTK